MKAKLVFCNVPALDAERLLPFYGALLGIEPDQFIRNRKSELEQYYEPVAADGVDLTITQKNDTREVTITYWAVEDLDSAMSELERADGKPVSGPTKMPDGGQTAVMLDPEGNYVGLVQLADHAQEYFRVGEHGSELYEQLQGRRKEALAAAE